MVLNFLKDEINECDGASEDSGVHVDLRNCNYYVLGRKWTEVIEEFLKKWLWILLYRCRRTLD
ncbi:hypothetical protein [Lysinibacillus sp. fls2-241-R2A-57]|uniref:hypothetical protein n=1 Tax=Lysinibacillus sp. fls2-241-R2A-57 TaxID=3040292 RepID=UPI00255730E9|nr:hypothetical protein [Lysinibacillus sp. fls2-241-R2A-57]